MGRQRHVHLVVDVEPFRVVVHLLGHEGDPAHEAPGFIEGLEGEALADRVPAVDLLPAGEVAERLGALLLGQLPGHGPGLPVLIDVMTATWCGRAAHVKPRAEPDGSLHHPAERSEEHTSELQSLMRNSYAVF